VGFDRMFDMLQHSMRGGAEENYPPFDIERTGEDSYRVIPTPMAGDSRGGFPDAAAM
jgi:HSP20 family molecular chaperone IbpA